MQERDKFEQYLDEMVLKVQACQEEKNVSSCSLCTVFFVCELRSGYVKAVYSSMSKGDTGDFEF